MQQDREICYVGVMLKGEVGEAMRCDHRPFITAVTKDYSRLWQI